MSARARIVVVVALTAASFLAVARAGATVTTFDFHRMSNLSSVLTIYRQDTLDGSILNRVSYRAGSGLNTNECDSAQYDNVGGWLPAGYYSLWGHWNNYGGTRSRDGSGTSRTSGATAARASSAKTSSS